ncbi:hypothetical protein M0638_25090 [Roseomonas sp. NAR14]|uniref:Uncharacterized protein n=1 Tax=Roseomonas acroporae TaxID=2937791 RepID=A0A9X2BWG1_9PROT|nr:hypothetical protein [Roseomonas acroporae]MCK8787647.1 hypothetical protein [Roseomonas acroporae]
MFNWLRTQWSLLGVNAAAAASGWASDDLTRMIRAGEVTPSATRNLIPWRSEPGFDREGILRLRAMREMAAWEPVVAWRASCAVAALLFRERRQSGVAIITRGECVVAEWLDTAGWVPKGGLLALYQPAVARIAA